LIYALKAPVNSVTGQTSCHTLLVEPDFLHEPPLSRRTKIQEFSPPYSNFCPVTQNNKTNYPKRFDLTNRLKNSTLLARLHLSNA
jgi:hypothetical protein